ncbi:nicotinate (nicotinamide) nucleotide adenylyltransferase [Sneathiella sp.]|jgi:nicotinate-nucleotide adenylyltransferase|uniref:nicotinate (nicotinamide) nucleotide adenylyltransferase n=1 Tax=Sneathiella sp. TaxID=1964365 RepID=UPI0039E6E097
MRARKIGLLGGSFNPAHEGHLYISETALRTLDLDEVWWLVSPQNPLKSAEDMGRADDRIQSALKIARGRRIKISTIEFDLRETYTANTIQALQERHPFHHFVWLMGADNLIQIPKWYHWREIFDLVPIAVFDRPGYTQKALSGKAATLYAKRRVFPAGFNRPIINFATGPTPRWTFISHTKHKLSSTQIRNLRQTEGKACS